MKKRKLAVELYSLREASEQDFPGVLKFVADTGYLGVEPAAGLYGLSPREFKHILDDLGLEVKTTHFPYCRKAADVSEALDVAHEWGMKSLCCGYGRVDFQDLDAIRRTADQANEVYELVHKAGLTLIQHNHYWEFERLDGRLKYDIYLDYCPNIRFQLDAFWAANFGAEDPVAMIQHFADRIDSIHIKDGDIRPLPGTEPGDVPLHPLGDGQFDLPGIVAAIPDRVDDIIVELDRCSIEMHEGLIRSYRYMTENGLGYGSK